MLSILKRLMANLFASTNWIRPLMALIRLLNKPLYATDNSRRYQIFRFTLGCTPVRSRSLANTAKSASRPRATCWSITGVIDSRRCSSAISRIVISLFTDTSNCTSIVSRYTAYSTQTKNLKAVVATNFTPINRELMTLLE